MLLLKIVGVQPYILGAHTVNQHANQIFTFLLIFNALLITILIIDAEITMCCFKLSVSFYCDSHLSKTVSRFAHACVRQVRKRQFHGGAPACRTAWQSPALVRVTRTIWIKRVGSDDWTARVGRGFCDCERDFTGAGYVNQERRSQLKPSTVDAQQSKAPSQTPDSVNPL